MTAFNKKTDNDQNTQKSEKKLDKELKDTFPASDPPSGNICVGAPDEDQNN